MEHHNGLRGIRFCGEGASTVRIIACVPLKLHHFVKMISNMASHILFAALLLASASFGHSRMLAQDSSPSMSPSMMTMEESPSPSSPVIVGPGSDNLTATNKQAMETGGALPVVPPSACNATKSPEIVVSSGSKFSALLNGTNNIKPNTTGARRVNTLC
jgi:hypothetical protein